VVLASAVVAGESLSELPCEDGTSKGASRETLLECRHDGARTRLIELVAQRYGESPVLARATTAADGSFTLEGLEAGPYSLWVESAEGTGLRHGVAAGDEGVELRLGVGVRLSGSVVDEAHAPVAGALVTAIFMAHSRFFETVTDERGRFRLGPLPRGRYAILIARDGLLTLRTTFLAHASELEETFTLKRPRRIMGHVLRAGAPVVGVEVLAQRDSSGPPLRTFTDASGGFSFEGLMPFSHELRVTHDGYGAIRDVSFEQGGAEDGSLLERVDVTVELEPVTQVRGVVRDEELRPIEGAWVEVHRRSGEDDVVLWGGRTDAEGRYGPGLVWPGLVSFELRADGYVPLRDHSQSVPAGEAFVDFTLARAPRVEGILVDAEGQPLVGEKLVLRVLEGRMRAVADESSGPEGRFSLDAPTPGRYLLEVVGLQSRHQEMEVLAPSSQRIVSERLPRVVGEVVDEAGVPLPSFLVGLSPTATERQLKQVRFRTTITDLRGHFSLAAPAEGHYQIVAESRGDGFSKSASQRVEVGKGGARVRLRLEEGYALSGVVVDRSGHPIEAASVSVASSAHLPSLGCGPSIGVDTGPDGRFTLQGVSGEELELLPLKEGYRIDDVSLPCARGWIHLAPGTREVRVVLRREAFIRGRLVSAKGSPISRFQVNGQMHVDEDGEFRWPFGDAGMVRLELAAPDFTPARRTLSVQVQEGVDVDLGTITLGP
jgi:hypothetical protein